jgi:hypothetical protein
VVVDALLELVENREPQRAARCTFASTMASAAGADGREWMDTTTSAKESAYMIRGT